MQILAVCKSYGILCKLCKFFTQIYANFMQIYGPIMQIYANFMTDLGGFGVLFLAESKELKTDVM